MDDENLQRIELETKLLRLDMEWERDRQKLLLPFKGVEPTGPPIYYFVFAAVWFVGWLFLGAALAAVKEGEIGAGIAAGSIIGVMGLIMGITSGFYLKTKYQAYRNAKDAYEQYRRTLLQDGNGP
jgi:hypothetical protein